MGKSEFTEIMTFNSYGEAVVYKSLLDANGIDCQLFNKLLSGILPIAGDSTMVRLVVPTEQAKLAQEVLDANFSKSEFDTESRQSK